MGLYGQKGIIAVGIVILVLAALPTWYYLQEVKDVGSHCESAVKYHPTVFQSDNPFVTAESEHYSYANRKFKTKKEAEEYCVNLSTR